MESGLKADVELLFQSTVLDRIAEVANVGSIQLIVDMVVDVRKFIGGKRDVTSSTRSFVVVVVIERTRLGYLFSGLASGNSKKS